MEEKRSRRIPPQLRKLVWETYNNDPNAAYGLCAVCSNKIHILNFECGHIISHAQGGNIKLENLRPICGSCNKSMGAKNLFEYKEYYFPTKTKGIFEYLSDKLFKLQISSCEHILIKGKRKGQKCGKKIFKHKFCIAHS